MNELFTVEGTCHCGAIQVTARVDRGLVWPVIARIVKRWVVAPLSGRRM